VEGLKWGMNAGMGVIWRIGERCVGEATATACATFVCGTCRGLSSYCDGENRLRFNHSTPVFYAYTFSLCRLSSPGELSR
jgi:hypothetical protein